MKSSFSMSGGTVKDCSATAEPLGDAAVEGADDAAADGAALVVPPPPLQAARNARQPADPLGAAGVGGADAAAADGAALVVPPPPLQAARNAAVADIALAHMKPRRLRGVRSNRQRIWRTYRSKSWSATSISSS